MFETVYLPDGSPFLFWEDTTQYRRVYHVARDHPAASDDGPGSEDQPFATIGRAVQILQPGEKTLVHRGVYRECIRPTRGGTGPDQMIAYEAAPGETVVVRGSEIWQPAWTHDDGWSYGNAPVWVGDLPAEWFVGYNPFVSRNFSSEFTTFISNWSKEENQILMLRRGMVFADGRPLNQVYYPKDLADGDGVFWVEDPGLRLHLRLWGDADPRSVTFEVTAREQVFAPNQPGLGYIRLSGFRLEHAADGFPVPQRALVSAGRGHHWIIEDNQICWANACGMDVGNETWHRRHTEEAVGSSGRHIIRRNRVANCGICGIAAVGNNAHTLVEDNTIEHIGSHGIERLWENGGLKFHLCDSVLIRRNLIRHIHDAPGIWLDYRNKNSRVTGNVLHDISSILGGIFIEVSHAPNWVDHNLLWELRGIQLASQPAGIINIDTGEKCVVAHNLLGHTQGHYAIAMHRGQAARIVDGRVGLCRCQKILNNLFVGCSKRILLAHSADNQSDGNLFDEQNDAVSLCVEYPEPKVLINFEAWQTYFGFDLNGRQVKIEASFNPETLEMTLEVSGDIPTATPMEGLTGVLISPTPGPVALKAGRQVYPFCAGRKA